MASKSFSIKQYFQVMLSLKKKKFIQKDTRAHKIVVRNFVYLHDKQQLKGDKKRVSTNPSITPNSPAIAQSVRKIYTMNGD